jgi:integrase
MTTCLAAALPARSRGGPLVFSKADDLPITTSTEVSWLKAALKAAKLRVHGPHTLRHTFCSHLAMRGVAARVIQQLAGHSSLVTTQRYMHLPPGATEAGSRCSKPAAAAGWSRSPHRLGVWRGAGDGQRSLAKHGLKSAT